MEQLIAIGEDYIELCQKADKFISDFKEFYKRKRSEEEDGKDAKRINEIQANSNNDDTLRKQEKH